MKSPLILVTGVLGRLGPALQGQGPAVFILEIRAGTRRNGGRNWWPQGVDKRSQAQRPPRAGRAARVGAGLG